MSRWNIKQIVFFGVEDRRRTIDLLLDDVNIITGASGTGKSAIIDAIDYCLGSSKCGLPWFVRERAEAVAVHWKKDQLDLIVGRNIPRAGKGTNQMFVRVGSFLKIPSTVKELEGRTPRETAMTMIERAFGIADTADVESIIFSQTGRASIRHATPYMFLSGDVIVSQNTLIHDMNRVEKARDIKATLPYFLGAVDQKSVLAERQLRQLEAALGRIQRKNKANERSQSKLTERSMALLSQAAELGLAERPNVDASDQLLLEQLRKIVSSDIVATATPSGDVLSALEQERQLLINELTKMRGNRRSIRKTIRDASGYETAVSGQAHKLDLINHLNLTEPKCPICDSVTDAGHSMANQIRNSLEIIRSELATVDQIQPELKEQSSKLDEEIDSKSSRFQEVEVQISALIRQKETAARASTLAQAKAILVGRISQFLETTVEDFEAPSDDSGALLDRIALLQDEVDPQAKRDRLRDAESMISMYATSMLSDLPTEVPATNAKMLFTSMPRLAIIEPERRSVLSLIEIGSDQNYLSLHLALYFAIQKHFENVDAPIPGTIVIDQISRPYYSEGGDEKGLAEMGVSSDRVAMRKIIDFLFEETARRIGLQVLLLEHAYIHEDSRYVSAITERWTKASCDKLIPADWPERQ